MNTKTPLKIFFADFWKQLQSEDNYFFHLLKRDHNVSIDPVDPDILFISCYGDTHKALQKHRSKKIYFSGENWHKSPECDIQMSLTSSPDTGNNVHLPLWVLFLDWFGVGHDRNRNPSFLLSLDQMLHPSWSCDDLLNKKKVFCSFVVQNPDCKRRISFCKKMMRRGPVVCPGRVLNNTESIGGRGDQIEKISFLKSCRFNIAFENSRAPGYVTEKVAHALYAGCIPLYWGGKRVKEYFNEEKIIYCDHPWKDWLAIRRAVQLNDEPERLVQLLNQPSLTPKALVDFSPERMLQRLYKHNIL